MHKSKHAYIEYAKPVYTSYYLTSKTGQLTIVNNCTCAHTIMSHIDTAILNIMLDICHDAHIILLLLLDALHIRQLCRTMNFKTVLNDKCFKKYQI